MALPTMNMIMRKRPTAAPRRPSLRLPDATIPGHRDSTDRVVDQIGRDYGNDDNKTATSAAGSGVTGAGGSAAKVPTAGVSSGLPGSSTALGGGISRSGPRIRTNERGMPYTTVDAGPRRLENSSVDWGNFAGINNWLSSAGPVGSPLYQQRADYLNRMGIMPSYNGQSLTGAHAASQIPGMSSMSGPYLGAMTGRAGTPEAGANNYLAEQHQQWVDAFTRPTGMIQQDASGRYMDSTGMQVTPSASWMRDDAGRLFDSATLPGMAGTPAGLVDPSGPGGGGLGGLGTQFVAPPRPDPSALFGGGPLEGAAQSNLLELLSNKGNLYTPEQAATMRAQQTDAINRATQESLTSAREDAIRRGDFSGSTLGDREARIRRSGANDAIRQGTLFDANMRSEQMRNLMAALGGATNLAGLQSTDRRAAMDAALRLYGIDVNALTEQQRLALLEGQLSAQGAFGGPQQGLNLVMGL